VYKLYTVMRKDAAPCVRGSAYQAITVHGCDDVCATGTETRMSAYGTRATPARG